MTTIDMTQIITKAEELNNDLNEVAKALKRIQSVKCRLKQAPGRKDYQENMTACLQEEQLIKNVKYYLTEPRKTVNDLTEDDIADMNYDEVCRAIRSIQSKKTHTKWADDCEKDDDGMYIPGSGGMFKEACRIEEMLKAHRDALKPEGASRITKAALRDLITELRLCSDLDTETCLDRIEAFLDGDA